MDTIGRLAKGRLLSGYVADEMWSRPVAGFTYHQVFTARYI
jgi:hypothetical protein